MRRVLMFSVIVLMLVASTASAEMYASLRVAGTGNYQNAAWSALYGDRQIGMMPQDSGLFNYKELALGFGDKFKGEVSFGFSTLKYEWEEDLEARDTETISTNWYTIGLAGMYEVMETENATIDVGLRFQWHNSKIEESYEYRADETYSFTASGWSIGPMIKHEWMLADGAIGIGPEVYIKYTNLSTEYKAEWEETRASATEDGPDIIGWDVEYSLRMDFYF